MKRHLSSRWLLAIGLIAVWLGAVRAAGRSPAVMATAALLVAVSGFMMGGGVGESFAEQRYVVASNQLSDTNNELSAFFDTDGI